MTSAPAVGLIVLRSTTPSFSTNSSTSIGRLANPRAEIETRTGAALALVGLTGFGHRRITELSGGEQQRVALARALAAAPRLLMLDEPLGALDRALRERLVTELRALFVRLGLTSLFVTHDHDEAFALADRLVVMHEGRIEQVGSPVEVWQHPANAFVARFLGWNVTGAFLDRSVPAVHEPAHLLVIELPDLHRRCRDERRIAETARTRR